MKYLIKPYRKGCTLYYFPDYFTYPGHIYFLFICTNTRYHFWSYLCYCTSLILSLNRAPGFLLKCSALVKGAPCTYYLSHGVFNLTVSANSLYVNSSHRKWRFVFVDQVFFHVTKYRHWQQIECISFPEKISLYSRTCKTLKSLFF
jgi:hypothetical protein